MKYLKKTILIFNGYFPQGKKVSSILVPGL